MLDQIAAERAEAEIDQFILKRDRSKENALDAMWKASDRRHQEKRRRENQAAWYGHHDHMSQLHASLSEEHRSKAQAFLSDQGEGVT